MKIPAIRFKKNSRHAVLVEDYTIKVNDAIFTLKKGFDTDGASIPRFLWWFCNPWDSQVICGALVHDAGYWSKSISRETADAVFYAIMKEYGASFPKRFTIYLAVRCFGWIFYYTSKKPSQKMIDRYLQIKRNMI
jgi:hypothetical protein